MSSIVVAVDWVRVPHGGVAASAVLYPVNRTAPSFTYLDKRKVRHTATLEDYAKLPAPHRANVVRYLKDSALAWARVQKRSGDRETAAGLAVLRAVERLQHEQPEAAKRERLVVRVPVPLPARAVGRIWQEAWDDAPSWMRTAAAIVAKAPQARILEES